MRELLRTARVVGLGPMLRLFRAHRLGWTSTIRGFYTTRMMQALFNVGFFDEMQQKGSVRVGSFAASYDLDAEILQSLCDSLLALRILKREGLDYSLDSKGRVLAEVARGWFDGVYGYEEIYHSLEAMLRKEKAYGREVQRRPDFVAKGSGEMEKRIYFPLAIDVINRGDYRKVLDLGCGDGTFLMELCRSNPEVTGYGIDIAPEAIADGREITRAAGLEGRIHLFVEDVGKVGEIPEELRGMDVATTFFVLHEILFSGADPVIQLLQGYRRVFPDVPLMVFEVIRPTPDDMRKRPGMAVEYLLQHDLSHQKLVTREEWRELFRAAGFTSIEERYLGFARTSIFTLR